MSNLKKPLALGMVALLANAIQKHKNLHYGEYPKYFEMHPEVAISLVLELDKLSLFGLIKISYLNNSLKFMSVPIRENVLVKEPKLVDRNNNIVYL